MDLGLKGRCAVVTGASSGIGRAIAIRLALEGVRVVAAARRAPLLQILVEDVARAGGTRVIPIAADLAESGVPTWLASEAARVLDANVDILMNAAGASRPVSLDAPPSAWSDAMGLGFLVHLELTHALLPAMRRQRWGRVVTITGSSEPRFLSASTPAKAALHVWSKGASREVAADGVTMNCIQPGRIKSEQIARKYPTPELEAAYASAAIPMKRFGEGDDVAAAAAFLASEAAAYVTGIVMPVDGGFRYYAY